MMNYPTDRWLADGRPKDAEPRRVSLPWSLAYLALAVVIMIAIGSAAFAALVQ